VGRDLPLDAHFAIGNFIHDALNRNEIQVKGDGRAVRTYLDQRDLAIWLCALLYRGADGEAYNVGSDIPITILELANLVRETLAPQVGINFSCQASISNFRVRYVPNINKALTKLNLKIKYPLSQAIVEATHRSF
jgi:dTDP-glucose 4,6-dehydratase